MLEKTEVVNSSGAVSPATRATPSTAPVISPPIAVGSTMRVTIRQRRRPSASPASFSDPGTSASTSCAERATIGNSTIASASAPAQPDCWWPITRIP